jgi:CheY-like chemotaxis protein
LRVETAVSGFAAIEKAQAGNAYDVIFMDHMMPLMDGIETTRKLRGSGYTGTIVALTANALVGNDEMFRQNGFDGYISKPIDLRQLNAVLNKHIRDKHPDEVKKHRGNSRVVPYPEAAISPKLLEIFRRDAEKAVVTLRETAASGNIKLFTTTVHAMKSALANIGEFEKSQAAAALEDAGIKNDTAFISTNTEAFIESLETLVENILPFETAEDENAETDEDIAYLAEQLRIIELACGNYEDTSVYAVLDRLKEKVWKKETIDALEKIRDTLFLHSEFEEAAEQAVMLSERVCL